MVSVKCSICDAKFNAKPSKYYSKEYVPICGYCREQGAPDEHRCVAKNSKNKRCGLWVAEKFKDKRKCTFHGRD